MQSNEAAAAKILRGFEQSNVTFYEDMDHDRNTIERHGQLTGGDRRQAKNVDRAVSQLVAAVGPEIEYALIVNAPDPDRDKRVYSFAVFSRALLGFVEFRPADEDPQIVVRAVSRRSIEEIEVRQAPKNRDEGSLVLLVKYASGIALDVRDRDREGMNVEPTRSWLQELLVSLRADLAAA
jgi:hypothetical protein